MDTRWSHPWTAIVAGPTGAGKTVFIRNFLKHIDVMSDTVFERVILYYAEWQNAYKELRVAGAVAEFREGLPQFEDFGANDTRPKLVILDDLMNESSSSSAGQNVVNLFTKGSHHRNLSVFFLTQTLFHQGRGQRDR